jgi:uncharacterized protein (TIGR02186 family)
MVRIRNILLFLILLWPASIGAAGEGSADGTVQMTAVPNHIRVGTFYNGTGVRIDATVPVCEQAVVVIEGEKEEVTLNRKGKVILLWMNVGRIAVRNAPNVYILAASDNLEAVCPREEREKLRLGFDALRNDIAFDSNKPLTGAEFEEFLKLKRHTGTYDGDTKVILGPISGDTRTLAATLPIPAVIPAGDYDVRLYCFTRQELVAEASIPLSIEKIGLPFLASSLAYEHAALYGVLAVVIAIVTGISIGAIFSLKSGRGH